jgi:tetratricopeptide (TPR) repeat protein
MLTLASIGLDRGLFMEAAKLLERVLELAPNYHAARQAFLVTLQARGRWAEAIPHAELLLKHEPRNPDYLTVHAELLAQMGDYERSIAIFKSVAKSGTQQPRFWVSYAHALKNAGHRTEGVQAYRAALEIDPSLGDAWWGLANMKNVRFSAEEQAAMKTLLSKPDVSDEHKAHLNYALGRALELEGDYAASFRHYDIGARFRHHQYDYAPERWTNWTKLIDRTKIAFGPALFERHAGEGCQDAAPIFILGLPRVGSTLIEQILASHSAVEGTNELMELGMVLDTMTTRHGAYPECVESLEPGELAEFGARYIELTRAYRKTDRPFFIDKLPSNWPRCGLIHLILPNAKIIDARREAMSSCFSVFKQLFGFGSEYSYDQSRLADHYNDYVSLMGHFDQVLPGRIHRVMYEDMVQNTEREVRSLLAYCGLPFEPACLRFWETSRAVATPSSEQVRQPIFKDGMDQWRNYEPWLGILKKKLNLDAARAASIRVSAPRPAFSLPFDVD